MERRLVALDLYVRHSHYAEVMFQVDSIRV
jgi:hypothetical protein